MNGYFSIGNIIEVESSSVTILVKDFTHLETIHYGGTIYKGISVGTFVGVIRGSDKIVVQIIKESINNIEESFDGSTLLKNKVQRKLDAQIIGVIRNREYETGIKTFPLMFDDVVLLSKEELKIVFYLPQEENKNVLDIGKMLLDDDLRIKIPINGFFDTHIGVFGNTGSGKSNTVAKLYKTLFDKIKENDIQSNNIFVFVDFHNEYSDYFSSYKSYKNIEVFDILHDGKEYVMDQKKFWNYENLKKVLLESDKNSKYEALDKVIEYKDSLNLDLDKMISNEKSNSESVQLDEHSFINQENLHLYFLNELESIKTELNQPLDSNNEYRSLWKNKNTQPKNIKRSLIDLYKIKFLYYKTIFYNKYEYKNTYNNSLYLKLIKKINSIWAKILNTSEEELESLIDNIEIPNWDWNDFKEYGAEREIYINHFNKLLDNNDDIQNDPVYLEKIKAYLTLLYLCMINKNNNDLIAWTLYKALDNINVYNILTEIKEKQNIKILILSLKGELTEVQKNWSLRVANELFNSQKALYPNRINSSVHFIIDEAHNLISSKLSEETKDKNRNRLNLFEKFIREGRKFNFFLTISTQEPWGLDSGITSQLSNFFIHRFVNGNDSESINKYIANLNDILYNKIPILNPGQCVLWGSKFKTPLMIQVDKMKEEEETKNKSLEDIWGFK